MKLNRFNKQNTDDVLAKVRTVLNEVLAEFGVTATIIHRTYANYYNSCNVCQIKPTLRLDVNGEHGISKQVELAFIEKISESKPQYWSRHDVSGLTVELLGKTILLRGKRYKIAGWNRLAKSRPILLIREYDGKVVGECIDRVVAAKIV